MKFFTFYTKRGSLGKYFKLTPRGEDGFEEKRKEWKSKINRKKKTVKSVYEETKGKEKLCKWLADKKYMTN